MSLASRIRPAFLLDRVQANAGYEIFRVVQIPVIVMFRGKNTYTDTQHCGNNRYRFQLGCFHRHPLQRQHEFDEVVDLLFVEFFDRLAVIAFN